MKKNFINDDENIKEIWNDKFVKNKRPYCLKREKYSNLFSKDNKFISSEIEKYYFNYRPSEIIISFIFSVTFYLLLIDLLFFQKTITIVLFPIIYILGQVIQGGILPEPIYYSRQDFFNKMEKILNRKVIITLTSSMFKDKFHFKGQYTNDVTGNINIPKSVNIIKIGNLQYFVEENHYQTIKHFYLDIKTTPEINEYSGNYIYNLNSDFKTPPYNIINIILSVFLLQWLNALILYFVSVGDIVTIYPAKLITVNPQDNYSSPTNIVIHGNSLNIRKNVCSSIKGNEYDDLINKLKKKENEKKEKEEEERQEKLDRRKNTSTLSEFGDNHFNIRVKKEYDDVYLYLKVYDVLVKGKRRDISFDRMYLGNYDENINESTTKENNPLLWIYTPNGIDMTINVKKDIGCFSISIGDIFHDTFYI